MDFTSNSRLICMHLILVSMLMSTTFSIRVDFNTNTGPIRPPTSTLPPPVPRQPYVEPAPVWEDQSNDIPNPNPFRYVPPPPSRPRYNQNINNNDIETNSIPSKQEDNSIAGSSSSSSSSGYGEPSNVNYYQKNGNAFFVDVPPKFYKSAAKQQFYQQQYLNDVFSKNYFSKSNKYSIIAFRDKYRNMPYYVFYFARVPPVQ